MNDYSSQSAFAPVGSGSQRPATAWSVLDWSVPVILGVIAIARVQRRFWRGVELIGLLGFGTAWIWQIINERTVALDASANVTSAPVLLAMLSGGIASIAIWRQKRAINNSSVSTA